MASKAASPRSAAAQEASRRNGTKSKGPRTAAGKARSARNALKHGLRARQPILPENLPLWIEQIEAELLATMAPLDQTRREQLNRLLSILLMIDKTDGLIAAEFGRLQYSCIDTVAGENEAAKVENTASAVANLGKLVAYRHRFRAQRDMAIKRVIKPTW